MSSTPHPPFPDGTEPHGSPAPSSLPAPDPPRRRLLVRRLLVGLAALLLVAGASGYWALDRYVIEHVQIADVAAYEAAVRPSSVTVDGAGGADTGEVVADGSAGSTASDPVITESSYASDALTVTTSKVVTGSGNDQVTYYVADVTVADATTLRSGFANNQFGTNVVEFTSDIAEAYDAVFAINGDYYGFREDGIIIRNGVLYRDEGVRSGLALYADGTMAVYDETTTTGEQLLADGVWNTLSFGPALVDDGTVVDGIEDVEVDTNFGNHSVQGEQPRTGIGIIDTNHYVFVVADGRAEGYSRGVTMTEFAEIFQGLGASVAYNLDGGGSASMWFNGELVNDPLGRGTERGTSDILYVA